MKKDKSVNVGNTWIGRISFLLQKRNAISIQNLIAAVRKKELKMVLMLIMSLGKNIIIQIGLLMYTSLLIIMVKRELEVLMILIRTI